MKLFKNKKASILIYTIILTAISLLLASVLLSNKMSLINTQKYYKIKTQFFNQIKWNNTLNLDNLIKLNSNWSGFLDNISWSWADIKCRLQMDWNYLVEWNSWTLLWGDWRDDNCNDDNYLWTNSWNLIEDDDNLARKELIWIIKWWQNKNIFWNNKKIEEFIENNPNNVDIFNKTLSWVVDWNLFLDISSWGILTLIEYNKNRYETFWEIKEIKSFTWVVSWSWYIEQNSNVLSLNTNTWANTVNFNFSWSWYLLFLTNTWTNLISYWLSWIENITWSWIYLNPINDDINNTGSIEILWYDVIIDNEWNIFWKMLKKVFLK